MSKNEYMVDFEFKHSETDGFIKSSTVISTDSPINEDRFEDFDEIAKTLFRQIDGCTELRVLRIAENEPWLDELREILKGDTID